MLLFLISLFRIFYIIKLVYGSRDLLHTDDISEFCDQPSFISSSKSLSLYTVSEFKLCLIMMCALLTFSLYAANSESVFSLRYIAKKGSSKSRSFASSSRPSQGIHLLHHLPFYLKRFGPPVVFWMYSLERFNSWIIRRVKSRRYPESTVVQTYLLFEFANFLKMSGEIPGNALIHYAEETDGVDENEEHILPDLLSLVEFANLEMFYSPELRCELT